MKRSGAKGPGFKVLGIVLLLAAAASARDIVVSPGDSVEKARDAARSGDRIILHGGRYQLDKMLVLGPQTSGVTWMAFPGEKPVISGGAPVTGWTPDTNGIWKARLNRTTKLRQLYVNDRPAYMDEAPRMVVPSGWRGTFMIKGDEPWAADGPGTAPDGFAFDKTVLPKLSNPADLELQQRGVWTIQRVGFRAVMDSGTEWVALFDQPAAAIGTKFPWEGCALGIGGSQLFNAYEFLTQPGQFYFNTATRWLYYKPRAGENMATATVIAPYLETLVLVKGENLQTHARSIRFEGITFAHTSFAMMQIKGCDSRGDLAVQSNAMSVMYKNDGNAHKEPWGLYETLDVAPSAVKVTSAEDVTFHRCDFSNLGCQALDIENDVSGAIVNGNVFQWVEGGSVTIGHPQQCYIGKQNGDNDGWGPYHFDNSHVKWDESVEGLCRQVTVSNNLFRNVCWNLVQMIPITLYFGHDVSIIHNDIVDVPYSGITCGWGWGELNGIPGPGKQSAWAKQGGHPSLSMSHLNVSFNRIVNTSQLLGDAGHIYFLGDQGLQARNLLFQQDYAEVKGNYLAEDHTRGRADLIACDEGTSFLRVEENVLDGRSGVSSVIHRGTGGDRGKMLTNNWMGYHTGELATNFADKDVFIGLNHFVKRPPSTNVKFSDWPSEAQKIVAAAGLEPDYRDLFDTLGPVIPAAWFNSNEPLPTFAQNRAAYGSVLSATGATVTTSSIFAGSPEGNQSLLSNACTAPFAFHTEAEANPWVTIDLGRKAAITGLFVRNRTDVSQDRAQNLRLQVSDDGTDWHDVWKTTEVAPSWEIPLLDKKIKARYIRLDIRSASPQPFHLQHVEVWGKN